MPPTEKEEKALYQQIGGMASDITNIKETVAIIADKVDTLVTSTAILDKTAVKNPECTQRHVIMAQSMSALKNEILTEIKKVPTGTYPSLGAIAAAGTNAAAPGLDELKHKLDAVLAQPAPTFDEFRAKLDALTEQKSEKKRKSIQHWVGLIIGVLAIISAIGACTIKAISYMNMLNASMAQQSEQQREIRKELRSKPKVIYLKSDAGE